MEFVRQDVFFFIFGHLLVPIAQLLVVKAIHKECRTSTLFAIHFKILVHESHEKVTF